MRRELHLKVGLLALATVSALLAAEIAARLFLPPARKLGNVVGKPYPAAPSDYLAFTLPANVTFVHKTKRFTVTYETNSDGFRDTQDVPARRPDGQRRILLLGDSFALGWGVEFADTLGEQLEMAFASESSHDVRCVNGGYRAGYTLDQYYAFLNREGDKWEWDDIVVAVYTGNDLDDLRDSEWLETDDLGLPTKLITRRRYTDMTGRFLQANNYDPPLPAWIEWSRIASLIPQLSNQIFNRRFPKKPLDVAAARAEKLVQGIQTTCQRKGWRLHWLLIDPAKPADEATRCRDLIVRSIERNQGSIFVAESILARSGHGRDALFIVKDYHYTPTANQLVGAAFAEHLRSSVATFSGVEKSVKK